MRSSAFPAEERRRAAQLAASNRDRGERSWLRAVAEEYGVRPSTIRNWIAEFCPDDNGSEPSDLGPVSDPYPLRGIARCGLCDCQMLCRYSVHLGHVYACLGHCRRRRALPVDELHEAVLWAVSRSAPGSVRQQGRRDPDIYLVPALIHHVTVGEAADRLTLGWRPSRFSGRTETPAEYA